MRPARGWTADGIADLRAAIQRAFRAGSLVVYGSLYHLEEASRVPEDARGTMTNVFWDTIHWYLLLPTHELVFSEVAAGRPLAQDEPFETFWTVQEYKRVSRQPTAADQLAQMVATTVANNRADNVAWRDQVREDFRRQFQNMTPEEVTRRWWADSERLVMQWMLSYVESSWQRLGLQQDSETWPPPRSFQTTRALMSYYMARIYLNVGLQRRIGDGDLHDGHHYASACYADILVTEDRGFRETVGQVPFNTVQVIGLDEFAGLLGVTVH